MHDIIMDKRNVAVIWVKMVRVMKIDFQCIRCGLCCRNIGEIEQLKTFHDGDGICRFLDQETNLCMIYDSRTTICNVEVSYELFFYHYSEQEYLQMNYEGCRCLWEKRKIKKIY